MYLKVYKNVSLFKCCFTAIKFMRTRRKAQLSKAVALFYKTGACGRRYLMILTESQVMVISQLIHQLESGTCIQTQMV